MEIGRWLLPKHDREAIKWFDYIPQETIFWRRRVWDWLGGLDETFRSAVDWDFILRAHAEETSSSRMANSRRESARRPRQAPAGP